MQQHEKRIREALEAGEFEDLLFAGRASADLHTLLADLDAMRSALEGAQSLIRRHQESIRKDLDRCEQEEATEVMRHIRAALKE